MRYIVFLAVVGFTVALSLRKEQSVAVRGNLTCLGKPAAGVKVKLYDSNTNFLGVFDKDELMDSRKTNSNGEYNLSGSTKEFSKIEPYIAIYHKCNDEVKPCQRTFRVGIPPEYVTKGKTPKSTFEVDQLELADKYPNEGRSCLNR